MINREYIVFDIETNGLLKELDRFLCGSVVSSGGQVLRTFVGRDEFGSMLKFLVDCDSQGIALAGHNIINFDIPALRKLDKLIGSNILDDSIKFPKTTPLDTLILSHLMTPDLSHLAFTKHRKWLKILPKDLISSHSLKAWGIRLGGTQKATPPESWDTFTEEMLEYCVTDTKVNLELLKYFMSMEGITDGAVDLEMEIASIIQEQCAYGIKLDTPKAERLAIRLTTEVEDLKDKVSSVYPSILKKEFIAKVGNRKLGRKKGDLVQHWEPFNPGSNKHLGDYLRDTYGWEPQVFTPTGDPKLTEEIIAELEGIYPELNPILKYRKANKILSFVATGKNAWVGIKDSNDILRGNVKSCGAITRRMTHNTPNLGQVPSAKAYLGKECRELFIPQRRNYIMAGVDADQLELRTLAHYLTAYDNGEYARAAIYGSKDDGTDIHSINARKFGTSRDVGKTVFYGWLYGQGPEGIGRRVTGSWKPDKDKLVGLRIINLMRRTMTPLIQLKEDLLSVWKTRGYLRDLDGVHFMVKSNHSILNELNQRAGAILMKCFLVHLRNYLMRNPVICGYPKLLLSIHDEYQWEILDTEESRDYFSMACEYSWKNTTANYRIKLPISGKPAFGNSWAETH